MQKKEARERIKELRTQINKHNHLYHSLDQPEISDYQFDQLFAELVKLEEQFPDLKSEDSPSQKVGGEVIEAFEKMDHHQPMLSLQNTYSPDEILEFEEKIQRQLNTQEPITFYCTPKYDGVAIELVYENGKLLAAITRGDGTTGENVISNVKTIQSVPQRLEGSDLPKRLDVRGEVLIYKQEFARINENNQQNGQTTFANPRNAAAGTLRQLDSRIAAQRNLQMICYAHGHSEGVEFTSQEDFEQKLASWGLMTTEKAQKSLGQKKSLARLCTGSQSVVDYYHLIENIRHDLDFEIDGIVVKVNSFKLQRSLGTIARSPRWAFAAKFTPEKATTKIKDIQVQVGRTGALTPVAIMEPVKVGGVTITNATLHNQDEIDRKDVRVGDHVWVHRAGDVIPEILEVLIEKRPKNSQPYRLPDHCPACGKPVAELEGEVVKRCLNSLCPAVAVESLKHFVSRGAMNIDKLGAKQIEKFYEHKLVQRFSDIYRLQAKDILSLERQGEKSTHNLLESIEKSKNTQLFRLIFAMGMRFVGEQTARVLANHYKNVSAFLKTDYEELMSLPDIGPKVATSIMESLSDPLFHQEINELIELGVKPQVLEEGGPANKNLSEKTFVVTGTLPIARNEVQDLIRQAGGQVTSSVSKKTSVLVAGDNAGSKLEKAEKLGVEVWSWDDLQQALK